jgi:plastocyanin
VSIHGRAAASLALAVVFAVALAALAAISLPAFARGPHARARACRSASRSHRVSRRTHRAHGCAVHPRKRSTPPSHVPSATGTSTPSASGSASSTSSTEQAVTPASEAPPEAPAPGPTAPPSVPHVLVTAVEWRFSLSRTNVPAGKVVLQLVNHGQDEHNLPAVSEGSLAGSLPNTLPGEDRQLTLDMPAGTYTLFCSLPEHEQRGMKATLVVG